MWRFVPKWMWALLGIVLLAGATVVYVYRPNRMTNDERLGYGYETATVTVNDAPLRVQVPITDDTSRLGLAGRTSLADDEGMLWNFAQPTRPGFWMKGMLIPLDFIWIVDGQIVELTENVPPPKANQSSLPRYQPRRPVTHVLEVRAGWAADHRLKVGDRLAIFP